MINKLELKKVLIKAEHENDLEARSIVHHALAPKKEDTVEEIQEKSLLYTRLIYGATMTFDDAVYHHEIDKTFAEQIHSYLNFGTPRYKGIIIAGFRESAKSARFRSNQSYMNCYLPKVVDSINIVAEDGDNSKQFVMDMFNAFALSKIVKYFGKLISETVDPNKKESKTMAKFTTTTGITYYASSARKTKRGNVKQDIDELTGEIGMSRPKEVAFDDIESEVTVRSLATTQHVGDVMKASIDGMDQVMGFWVILGNVLSIRGNVMYYLKKYRDDPNVKIIEIPLYYKDETIAWPAKYCWTDAEQLSLAREGINKVSIETKKRDSDNFNTEFLNDPQRGDVYFPDVTVNKIDESKLISEDQRGDDGWLIMEDPEKGVQYIISADTALGNGGDQSGAVIWKVSERFYTEVGNYKSNKVRPEDFAADSVQKAREYNHAFLIVERNYPGNEFILIVKGIYNNYFVDKTNPDGTEVIGVHTNSKTKPDMFAKFKKFVREEIVIVRSRILYTQILEYPIYEIHKIVDKPKGKATDDSGGHFDLLMAGVIGIYQSSHATINNADDVEIDRMLDYSINNSFEEDVNNL